MLDSTGLETAICERIARIGKPGASAVPRANLAPFVLLVEERRVGSTQGERR